MSLQTNLENLATAIGTDVKSLKTMINGNVADLTGLTTTDKTNLVAAINEVQAEVGAGGTQPDATETVKGIVELATLAEVATGTDAVRAVTPAGVRQERVALKAEILGAGVPGALDTLDELAAALGDDANFASTVTTALANRVRVDINTQGLTALQQGNARTNIDVYSKAEIGNPETDFVATYNTAKA